MKTIILMLGALVMSGVIVGCGPAVGRAVGDTTTTNGGANGGGDATANVHVDQQLGDFKKEQTQQIQTVEKDFRTEMKETQTLFSKQEEEFYRLKNVIDVLETELSVVKETPNTPAPGQPDMADFKAVIEHNEEADMELKVLHERIDSLEDQSQNIQSLLLSLDQRAEEIQSTVSYLSAEIDKANAAVEDAVQEVEGAVQESVYNTSADIDELRTDFQTQLDSIADHANSLSAGFDEINRDTEQLAKNLDSVLTEEPEYPISVDLQMAYREAKNIEDELELYHDVPCVGANNLRRCLDEITAGTAIYSHTADYEQLGVTFTDACLVKEKTNQIQDAYGTVVDIVDRPAYLALIDVDFISAVEWDILRYISNFEDRLGC